MAVGTSGSSSERSIRLFAAGPASSCHSARIEMGRPGTKPMIVTGSGTGPTEVEFPFRFLGQEGAVG